MIADSSARRGSPPSITVILCTRDRPADAVRAVGSVLRGCWSNFELLILDQSSGAETSHALAEFIHDARVSYESVPLKGKTTALNRGITRARGQLFAFLDDDCEAPADWLARIAVAFAAEPQLMLLVGAVVAGPHDSILGFIPTFEPHRRLCGLRVLTFKDNPMGANMAMRRTLPSIIGPFDPLLGAGAPLHSSYDMAYCYRAYRLGHRLCADPAIIMVHHGFRTWREGRRLVQGYALGTAAAYTKFVRLGDPVALALLVRDIAAYALRLVGQLVRRRRPLHLSAFAYRFVGIAQSFRYDVVENPPLYRLRRLQHRDKRWPLLAAALIASFHMTAHPASHMAIARRPCTSNIARQLAGPVSHRTSPWEALKGDVRREATDDAADVKMTRIACSSYSARESDLPQRALLSQQRGGATDLPSWRRRSFLG